MIAPDQLFKTIAWIVVIAYLAFQGIHQRWIAVGATVLIFVLLYLLKIDLVTALLLSVLGAMVVALPTMDGTAVPAAAAAMSEHFADAPAGAADSAPSKSSEAASSSDAATTDSAATKADTADADAKEKDTEEPYVDAFSTFMESYKSFTPDQLEHMTTDTKELIETQKSLMETVKSLTPVVTQGKEMLDTFKDFFGKDGPAGGGRAKDIMGLFKGMNGGGGASAARSDDPKKTEDK